MPKKCLEAKKVIAKLDLLGSPATVASAGPRYFGFVTGGSLPVALAANWLAGAWDQNAFSSQSSPLGAELEVVCLEWLRQIFGFPVKIYTIEGLNPVFRDEVLRSAEVQYEQATCDRLRI